MLSERELAISPIVPDSVAHNAKTVNRLHSLTSPLFGIAAGILGLESWPGFVFYLLGTLLVSTLLWALRAERRPDRYFLNPVVEMWANELLGGLSGFVLAWTGVFGLVRA